MRTAITAFAVTAMAIALSILTLPSTLAGASFTFRGYPSGWSPAYFDQTVVAPCHARISARISAPRYDLHADDVPITIEFRAPGVSVQAPPTHVEVFMSKLENTRAETFTVPGHTSGCGSSGWRVRIIPYGGEVRDGRITGDLNVSFVNSDSNINIEDAATLANGRSTTKNVGGSSGLHQGWVDITGTWNHSVFGVPGPLPVKLNFALLKPNGDIAAFDTGHSNHEINPCCSGDKLRLRFRVAEKITGQWKLRITNDSGQDAMTIVPRATFKPACQ